MSADGGGRLREALAAFEALDGRADACRPVARRAGKETWRVDRGGRSYAVEIRPAGPASAAIVERIERVLAVAAPVGIAPTCRVADRAHGIVITDWIEGGTWAPADLRRPGRLDALAATLRTLHALRPAVDPIDVIGAARAYRARIEAGGLAGDADVRRALDELVDRAAAHDAGPAETALAHGDATVGNVVGGDRPALVDWEYAGLCDRRFDLATVTALHDLDAAGRAAFLRAYGGDEPDGLAESERLVVLLAWAWARAARLDDPHDERSRAWESRLSRRVAGPT